MANDAERKAAYKRAEADITNLNKIYITDEKRNQLVESLVKLYKDDPLYYQSFMEIIEEHPNLVKGTIIEAAKDAQKQIAEKGDVKAQQQVRAAQQKQLTEAVEGVIAESEEWLSRYGSVGYMSPKGREGAVKYRIQLLADEKFEVYDALVKGISSGKLKVSDDLKGIVTEFAKQREIEAQNRTDRGKLYEVVDKDLRALKTPEEKKAFATRLETYAKRKGYNHEYYKAAVVLVDSKEYPEDIENLVREADKKVKEKAAKANEGAENGGNSGNEGNGGNEGGAGGGRAGGAGGRSGSRTTGNITLDRACAIGPTAIMEFIENDLKQPIDASLKRKGKTGYDYIPTSKLKGVLAGLSAEDRAKVEAYVKSDRFNADVDKINERDESTPNAKGGRGSTNGNGGAGGAGGNNGNDEAPEPIKKAATRGEKVAMGMAAAGMPVSKDIAKLLDEEFAKQDAAKAAQEAKEAAEKARQEEIAKYKKLYAENKDEFNKQRETAERIGDKKKFDIMNEAEKVAKAEERDTKFKKYKELLLKNPDMFKSAKETAKQNLDIPEARENLKLMEDVEKYVKLEKQMQKDLKKAKEKEEKAKKAYDKGKTEKGKKYDDKAKELRAEAGKLSEQMRELNPGEKQAAEPISATRAKELSEAMKKDKGKSKESLGNRILSAVGLKKGKEQGQQTAAQVLSAEAQTQTAAVGKKAVREVNGNVTKYTMSGVDNDDLAKTDLCNGTYIVTYKDGKPDTIQFTDGGNAPVITFEYKNDKEKAKTVQNLNNIFNKYNPEIALAMQKGNERG